MKDSQLPNRPISYYGLPINLSRTLCRFAGSSLPRILSVLVTAAALTAAPTPARAAAQSNNNPGIIPPNAHYGGLTYAEWIAQSYIWSSAIPAPDNPLLPGNEDKIATGQPNDLWFMVDLFLAPRIELHFTVPTGKALYFPIIVDEMDNFVCVNPPTTYSVDELRALAKALIDSITGLQVQVDGVPVKDLAQFRTTTAEFSSTFPDNNFVQALGCSTGAGTYGPMVADGYALILEPLSPGEHTVHAIGCIPGLFPDTCQFDVTWHITVKKSD